jgi:hypothetical protein
MIVDVSGGHNGFGNARRIIFPIWNETSGSQVLIACTIIVSHLSLSLSLSLSVTLQRGYGDYGAEGILCAAFCDA